MTHPLVKQTDLCNWLASFIGKVFTAGGFTRTLICRQYSVSHCLSSFPPQVDIVQTCIIEMKNRPGKPLFHLEHYIEGKYIKYNSNSGFVRDDNIRLTPQVSLCLVLSTESVQGISWLYPEVSHYCQERKGQAFQYNARSISLFAGCLPLIWSLLFQELRAALLHFSVSSSELG